MLTIKEYETYLIPAYLSAQDADSIQSLVNEASTYDPHISTRYGVSCVEQKLTDIARKQFCLLIRDSVNLINKNQNMIVITKTYDEFMNQVEENVLNDNVDDTAQLAIISTMVNERSEIAKLQIESDTKIKKLEYKAALMDKEYGYKKALIQEEMKKIELETSRRLEILDREIKLAMIKKEYAD